MLFDHMIEVLDPEPHDAALNMAIDETLLRAVTTPILRIYRWARPAVSFGYFGKWDDVVRAWPDREIVRRWTGGGFVLHGEDVTYSIIVPRAHPFFAVGPRESYRAIHECVARVIASASLAASAAQQISASCFGNPVPHDVLIADRKVAGAAQRRAKFGLLHQGSIQGVRVDVFALAKAFSSRVLHHPVGPEILTEAAQRSQERYARSEWTLRC